MGWNGLTFLAPNRVVVVVVVVVVYKCEEHLEQDLD